MARTHVQPKMCTGKFPRLQKEWPREQRSSPFTNRSDFYRYKGRIEAQIWQADYPEEAERLLSLMRSTPGKRPTRSELQATYALQWRIKNVWQPRTVFKHLVRTICAEHDSQRQTPRHSDKDAQRWHRWIRFSTETQAVSAPAELPALKDFFYQHRTMTRVESIPTRVHTNSRGNGVQTQRIRTYVPLCPGKATRLDDSGPRRLTRSPTPCLEWPNFYSTGPVRE